MIEFLKDFWCGVRFIFGSIGIPLGIALCLGWIMPYHWFVTIATTIAVILLLNLIGSDLRRIGK